MDGWRQLSREEIDQRARRHLLGAKVETFIVAQWLGPGSDRGSSQAELTLFQDGSVQLEGTAPVDVVAHLLAAWHNHQHGRPT